MERENSKTLTRGLPVGKLFAKHNDTINGQGIRKNVKCIDRRNAKHRYLQPDNEVATSLGYNKRQSHVFQFRYIGWRHYPTPLIFNDSFNKNFNT
jgi:hypothetical protein